MRVFLSYRRSDYGGQAGFVVRTLHDGLERAFGSGSVTWDAETPHGTDFRRVIDDSIAQSSAVVVLIGPDWLAELGERAGSGEDHVRYEIETALRLNVPVVPVLADHSAMPKASELPPSISRIATIDSVILRTGAAFDQSLDDLRDVLDGHTRFSVVTNGPFAARIERDAPGSLCLFRVTENGRPLGYGDVLDRWEGSDQFVEFYISLFRSAGFSSYVWETPPITQQTSGREFEFVLLNTPISSGLPDRERYQQYYEPKNADDGVVVFFNLGGDAKLVVPSPLRSNANYSNLPHFFREAPLAQQRSLWRVVARTAKERLREAPLWISVAGGGIAWLHVRLDQIPKYYRHAPYRTPPAA